MLCWRRVITLFQGTIFLPFSAVKIYYSIKIFIMANYNEDWGRDRNYSKPWNEQDEQYDQRRANKNYSDSNNSQRSRDNYDRRETYGLNEDQGKDWGRNRYNEDNRNYMRDDNMGRGDNDNSYSRGMYGNSTGVNRGSGNYMGDSENYNRNSGNQRYAGNDYGNYGNYNRNRDNDERGWWDKTKDEVSSWFGDDDAQRRRRMDERMGQHKGRGPKGYTRSDERIKEDVNDKLSDDSHIDASDIEVKVESCEVVLTGTVDSRFAKRHAEDLAESVSGVKNVENRLRVSTENNRSSSYTNSGSGYNSGSEGASGASPVGAFDIPRP
jgi:osmotically-inducible protein OsmY